ncbi:MAG: hypothetical protein M1824_003980 [Vezdaea acicularis]|nr:MAG: hypothetical protein M1824_003980 [Vezdaea acicularis]
MSSVRPFAATDIFKFNPTNLDPLTETYGIDFYFEYLARWPTMFNCIEGHDGKIDAYIMGKVESSPPHMLSSPNALPWHGHITALTVAPNARRLGLARKLTESLEAAAEAQNAWFVDLYVRASNTVAVEMYKKMGYSIYRRVVGYYNDDPTGRSTEGEDAFDMRKPLSRDKSRKYIRENGEDFKVNPEDVW